MILHAIIVSVFLLGAPDLGAAARAVESYEAGLYGEAFDSFWEALDRPGAPEGPILYNMGNCSFRSGRFAEAALLYRRALLRLPRSREVRFNLALAEQRLGLESDPELSFTAGIRAILDSFTPGELLALAGFLEAAALAGIVFARRRMLIRAALVLLLAAALTLTAQGLRLHASPPPREGVVLVQGEGLRAEPHAGFPIQRRLHAGECVRLEASSDRWVLVEQERGRGWMEREILGMVE